MYQASYNRRDGKNKAESGRGKRPNQACYYLAFPMGLLVRKYSLTLYGFEEVILLTLSGIFESMY